MPRNRQYIISDVEKTKYNDIERELSFWGFQLLNRGLLEKIDFNISNYENNDLVSSPTDLAIKNYVLSRISELSSQNYNDGEKEDYYGIYSASVDSNGMNNFLRVYPERYSVVTDISNPLVLKINGATQTIYNVQTISNSLYIPSNHQITLNCDRPGEEITKYYTEVDYTSITNDNNNNFYIIEIPGTNGFEYSTVRIDRKAKKIYFENNGSVIRGTWRDTSSGFSKINVIENTTYNLYEIGYVYIEMSNDGNSFTPHLYYTEPIATLDPKEDLAHSEKDNPLAYDLISQEWYQFDNSNGNISKINIQIIGMIGVRETNDLPEYVCSFAYPNYLELNQKNTIRLETDGSKVYSKDGSNTIFMQSSVIKTKNKIYTWEITGNNRYKTCFLYIDYNGNEQVSFDRPWRNPFGGYYLPDKNWRCVGSVFIDGNGTIQNPWDFNGSQGDSEKYNLDGVAQIPLDFNGIIKVTNSSNILEYDSDDYNAVIPVESGSVVEYIGEVNGRK